MIKLVIKGIESTVTFEELSNMATHRMSKAKKDELMSEIMNMSEADMNKVTIVFANRGYEINKEEEPAMVHHEVPHEAVVLQFPESDRPILEYLERNMETQECIRIPAPYSDCRRWCEEHHYTDPLIVVDHSFDKEDREDLQESLEKAIDNGIVVNGRHYVDVFASPSNIRNASSVFMDEAIADKYKTWAVAGTDVSSLPVVKQAQAWTLMMSTTTLWSKMFPHISIPHISKAYIGDDLEFIHKGVKVIRFVNDEYAETTEDIIDTSSDGQAYIVINDMVMSDLGMKDIMQEVRGCSLRFPGVKVSAQFILASSLIHAMLFYGKESFTDAYGHTFDAHHLPEIIMFKSGFKLSKVIKTKEQLESFQKRCDQMGHKFSVCITEHNPSRDLPAQVLQSMDFDMNVAKDLADKAFETIHAFMGPKSHYIVGGNLGKAAEIFPALRGDNLFLETWNSAIRNFIHRQLGGRLPKVTRYHIVSQDPSAVIQHILGVEVTGLIPDGYIVCNYPGYRVDQELGTYRMPNNDNNVSIVRKMAVPRTWKGLYLGNSVFVSIQSMEMLLKQMDFDGDKVGIFKDPMLIALAKASIKKQNRKPLVVSTFNKPEPKDVYTIEDWHEFDKGIIAAPVGLCANAASQAWACLPEGQQRRTLIYKASDACTGVIDRAKNPDDKGAARSAEELITSISPALGFAMFDKNGALKKTKMPRYQAWAKSGWLDDEEWERRVASTSFAPMSGVDWYSEILRLMLFGRNGMDESNVKLEQTVEWEGDYTTRGIARMLCAAEYGRCCVQGLGEFYMNLVRNATDEYKNVVKASLHQKQAQSVWTVNHVFKECVEFVRKLMPDATDTAVIRKTVSGLATNLYCKANDYRANEGKRMFWLVFGEIAIQILQENLSAGLWEVIQKEELDPKHAGVNLDGFVASAEELNSDDLPEFTEEDFFSSYSVFDEEEDEEC